MIILESVEQMQSLSRSWNQDRKIGFVPTMGYLHEGHLSLVKAAKAECDIVVVSIFVNPAQFGANEDLSTYPRDLNRDYELLAPLEVDYVFLPTGAMMYPEGYKTWVEVKDISNVLCGASRPGHFIGVATVVLKLVNLVKPDLMYMGEKDFQQIAVLRKMLDDLNLGTQIVPCPIVREPDGLALSSRNVYLSSSERINALCLSQAIKQGREMYAAGIREAATLKTAMAEGINKAGGRIDYISIVNQFTLLDCEELDPESRIILAVYLGKTRLIDNSSVLA